MDRDAAAEWTGPVPTASRATIVRKVPGDVRPIGRLSHELQKFKKEIKTKTVPELKDILNRQNAILSNQALLKTLPDKGAKVKQRKQHLEELIDSRTRALNEAADLLASLSISGAESNNNDGAAKKVDVDGMEWKFGGAHFMKKFSQLNPVDSDDDSDDDDLESDPLKLLAARSEVPTAAAKVTSRQKAFAKMTSQQNAYARVLDQTGESSKRFIPSHSVRKSVLSEKDKSKIHLKKSEDSTAMASKTATTATKTDPIPAENMLKEGKFKTLTLDLKESLAIQKEQAAHLKQMQLEHAASRLKAKLKIPEEQPELLMTSHQRMAYRSKDDYDETHEEEVDEVYDDDDAGASGGGQVNFTITEYED